MNTTVKRFIVTAVDVGESADGKARILHIDASEAGAKAYVKDDMDAFFTGNTNNGALAYEASKMSIHNKDYTFGCEWNIEEVEIKVTIQ